MPSPYPKQITAFSGHRRVASGPVGLVAMAVQELLDCRPEVAILAFDDATGAVVDLDLHGSLAEVASRFDAATRDSSWPGGDALPERAEANGTGKGRGRPKLGVIAREVTLLPRHWDWLATQPGG